MKTIRNVGYVNRQRSRSRLMLVLGIIMIVISFVFGFVLQKSNILILTYALLFAGFLLFNRGIRGIGRWSNNARHYREDLAMDAAMTNLPNQMTTVHFGTDGADTVDHLVVHPGGVLVLLAKDYPGVASVSGDKWRRGGSIVGRVFSFGAPQLGDPSGELKRNVAALESILAKAGLEDVPVESAIVFTAAAVEVEVDDSAVPVLMLDELDDFVRDLSEETVLKPAARDAIVTSLSQGEEIERSEPESRRRPVKVKRRAT